jgi:hypothetical protein
MFAASDERVGDITGPVIGGGGGLVLSNGPKRVGVSPPSPEDGNRSKNPSNSERYTPSSETFRIY